MEGKRFAKRIAANAKVGITVALFAYILFGYLCFGLSVGGFARGALTGQPEMHGELRYSAPVFGLEHVHALPAEHGTRHTREPGAGLNAVELPEFAGVFQNVFFAVMWALSAYVLAGCFHIAARFGVLRVQKKKDGKKRVLSDQPA